MLLPNVFSVAEICPFRQLYYGHDIWMKCADMSTGRHLDTFFDRFAHVSYLRLHVSVCFLREPMIRFNSTLSVTLTWLPVYQLAYKLGGAKLWPRVKWLETRFCYKDISTVTQHQCTWVTFIKAIHISYTILLILVHMHTLTCTYGWSQAPRLLDWTLMQ